MKIGTLALLLMCVAGGVVAMYATATTVSMLAPVDSAGNTVSNSTNMTMANVTQVAQVAPTAAVFVGLIVAAIILAVMVVYFASVFRRARR